ncbi:uncharacterized protein BYT42DRAFT_582341 [Radiomyces spectabilis]|uniref:uncharacterized protein n=1 Tax=Radiomyces spectabilis TaxID=64574 RepID=UPI00222011D7|nr:uncharacterized protein BYT42DRAFT_582341 [Radiomyces spectabilis]KAI8370422.1 hypothetical protein BYT42DRAFT_582341 [Radiomyces spectabilis]
MSTLNAFGFSIRKPRPANRDAKSEIKKQVVLNNVAKGILPWARPESDKPTMTTTTKRPVNTLKKKSLSKSSSQTNTITRYMTSCPSPAATALPIDTSCISSPSKSLESDTWICIVRHQKPIMEVWSDIAAEFDLDAMAEDFPDATSIPCFTQERVPLYANKTTSRGRRRRYSETNNMEEDSVCLHTPKRAAISVERDLTFAFDKMMTLDSAIRIRSPCYVSVLAGLQQEFDQEIEEEDLTRAVRHRMSVTEANAMFACIVDEFLMI